MLVIEDILGRCAPAARARRPASCARRNFYATGQTTPYGQPVRHAERLAARLGRRSLDDRRRRRGGRPRSRRSTPTHPHTKRALAITPVKFGISFNLTAFNQAGALVHVYKDGSVLINHGGTEMGQGLHTKMLQVAATTLGRAAVAPSGWRRPAPTRCPTPRPPRRARVPTSTAARSRTPASRSATGSREVAAERLGVHPADVRFDDGVVTGLGGQDETIDVGRPGHDGLLPARAAVGGRLLPHRGPALGRHDDAGLAVQVLRVRRRGRRGRGRRVHRGLPARAGSTSCTTSATACRR